MVMERTWDSQNRELRFIAMVYVYHGQKDRAFRTSMIIKHSNLTLIAIEQVSLELWSQ